MDGGARPRFLVRELPPFHLILSLAHMLLRMRLWSLSPELLQIPAREGIGRRGMETFGGRLVE